MKQSMYNSTIVTKDRIETIKRLRLINSERGVARALFERNLFVLDEREPVLTVAYGQATASVTKDGRLTDPFVEVSNSTGREDEEVRSERLQPGLHIARDPAILAGSVPLNKMIGKIAIPAGVCLILAGGGEGKTPVANAMAAHGVASYASVRVGEPMAGYTSSSRDAAHALAAAIVSHRDVVLDSIKDLLSGGGSAMKSGLSRDALVSISGWAALACSVGTTIYIPVNPSTPDPEVLQLMGEISRSNATMTMIVAAPGVWAYSTRTGEGLPRTEGQVKVKFDSDGLASIEGGTAGPISATEYSKYMTAALSVDAWSQAQRRAIAS